MYYKLYDTKWSKFVAEFPGRTESNLKNKFYSTLKKVATRAQLEDPQRFSSTFIKSKHNLIQFIDLAIIHGQNLSSKRGRKRNVDRELAPGQAILFPSKKKHIGQHTEGIPSFRELLDQIMLQHQKQTPTQFNFESGLLNIQQLYHNFLVQPKSQYNTTLPGRIEGNSLKAYLKTLDNVIEGKGQEIKLPVPSRSMYSAN